MNISRHETVLQVLTQRSQRFHHRYDNVTGPDDPTHAWAVDETGTVVIAGLNCENETEQQEISEMNNIPVLDEVLQVHGYAPPKKAEGMV
jgi:hypothetical protein